MSFVLLILGFVILIKSADILITSASNLAIMFSVPPFIIGFSVVAFGTSAPELVIGIVSGIQESNLITLGNIIGSCLSNFALIMGITAIIHPLVVNKLILHKELPITFGVQLALLTMLLVGNRLSRLDGIILVLLFIIFLLYIYTRSKKIVVDDVDIPPEESLKRSSKIKLAAMLLVSIAGVIWGGNLVVNSSIEIAHIFGLSEVLIGVTIVAFGTSLPELVTSIMAATKKQSDLALGNIIGSVIFNILLVLGISSIISPIPQTSDINVDMFIMLSVTLLSFIISYRKKQVSRFGGIILLTFYIAFIVFKVLS